MGKGKQDAAGQALRRQQIIDFIKKHGPVKSGVICAALSLSRSSLSDDINAVNAQAPVLISPKRGTYQYDPNAAASLEEGTLRGKLDRAHIRRWYLMAFLSDMPASFQDLLDELQGTLFSCSSATLHMDLKELKQEGYIAEYTENGRTFYRSSAILFTDRQEILHYHNSDDRGRNRVSPRMQMSAYDSINRKLAHCVPEKNVRIKSSAARYIGKQNPVTGEQLDLLRSFQQVPFSEYALSVPYTTNNGQKIEICFSTGLILYSVETNRIYLLGKDDSDRDTIIALDRVQMDRITVLQDRHNYVYQHPAYLRMLEEMFHLSTEPLTEVRVRFVNLPFVAEKIRRLCEIRKKAKTELINDGAEILYTDSLRGLADFARYLRRFGRSALVDEPAELRDMMLFTIRRTIHQYEGETQT